ncbi:hypothetical protein ES703_76671 [subsurface metagenome]
MKQSYKNIELKGKIILISVALLFFCLFIPTVHAGAVAGECDHTNFAIFAVSGGDVGSRYGSDGNPGNISTGTQIFVDMETDWTTVMKQHDLEIHWRVNGGSFAAVNPAGTGNTAQFEYWDSTPYSFATINPHNAPVDHFTATDSFVHEEAWSAYNDQIPESKSVPETVEHWVMVLTPETEGTYELIVVDYENDPDVYCTTTQQVLFNVSTPPDAPPTWSGNKTNASDATKTQQSVYFNVTLDDDNLGSYQIFAFYNGTDWVNDSAETWTKGDELEEIRTITAKRGQTVQWYWWFNDSEGQPNQTDTWNFTVANTAPTTPTTLTLIDPIKVTETLTANASGSSDADGNGITYYYQFYNTNDTTEVQAYSTDDTYVIQTTDAHDNIRVRAKAHDGYDYSGEKENNRQVSDTLPTDPTDLSLTVGGC